MQENYRVQRLILGGRRDMFDGSEMIEKRANFGGPQFAGMLPAPGPVAMELQEPPHPQHIGFLGAPGIGFDPQDLPQLIQQFGLWVGDDERSLCRSVCGVIF